MTDASQVEYPAAGQRAEPPQLVDITIHRVPFEPPKHRYFTSKLSEFREAIEFRAETDRPIDMSRSVTPVLFVGDIMLTEGEQVSKNTYTFLAFEKDRLEPGATISLAYPDTPVEARPESEFRYKPPE